MPFEESGAADWPKEPSNPSRRSFLLSASAAAALPAAIFRAYPAVANEPPSITVAATINTTRILGGLDWAAAREGKNPVSVSPDGARFATLLVTGDYEANGNWLTLYVGGLESVEAARGAPVAKLFQSGLGLPDNLDHTLVSLPGGNMLRWLNDGQLLFCWTDKANVVQIFRASLPRGEVEQLTHGTTDVIVHTVSARSDGTMIYARRTDHSSRDTISERLLKSGFAVQADDAFSLAQGRVDGMSDLTRSWDVDWYLHRGSALPDRLRMSGRDHMPREPWVSVISPDGRHAIVSDAPRAVPEAWRQYQEGFVRRQVSEWFDVSPDATFAKCLASLYLLDLDSGDARPFWPVPSFAALKQTVFWSPDSKSVIIGPTLLPLPTSDKGGLEGTALVELEVGSGRVTRLPFDASYSLDWLSDSVQWLSQDRLRIKTNSTELDFVRRGRRWRKADRKSLVPSPAPNVSIEARESLNEPPRLFAVDQKRGKERLVLDPNPALSELALARCEIITWSSQGREWKGLLYLPPGHRAGAKVPLVIQTHGVFSFDRFSLYGNKYSGLGPGTGIYAAQALAAQGFAVAQFQDLQRGTYAPAEEASLSMQGYVAGAKALIDRGVADPERVGILGFSRTGWLVQYTLAHSAFPFAAAMTSDNVTGGYVENTLWTPGVLEEENGGAPFGDGLRSWLARSPSFNAEKIATPLSLILQTGPIAYALSHWELFTRLRRLRKPVEFYVIPDIDHGEHALQNPRQVHAVQQRMIDWFNFWLADKEDPAPLKREQYSQWRNLRRLRA